MSIVMQARAEQPPTVADGSPAASGLALPVPGDLGAGLPWWFGPGTDSYAPSAGADVAGLVNIVAQAEGMIAWLRAVQVAAADLMVTEVADTHGLEPFEIYGPDASAKHLDLVRSVVTEELALATGIPEFDARARVDFATADPEAVGHLTQAMRDGACSWERARRVTERTAGQPAVIVNEVARRALAPGRDNEVVTWKLFCRRLSRAVTSLTDTTAARTAARKTRDVRAWLDENGSGCGVFQVTGTGERITGAAERVDTIARTLRRSGDARTLGQLRSDIALDLLMRGELAQYAGAAPPVRLSVTVSLATLVGAADAPGEHRLGPITPQVVRELACAEGTTLARIVTDPLTGAAIDATTDSYRPTAAMRRFIEARDHTCRAPGCTSPAERCDLDHCVDWPVGSTTTGNLSAKHRRHHEYKTRRWWHTHQDASGVIRWRTLARKYTTYPHDYDEDLAAEIDLINEAHEHRTSGINDAHEHRVQAVGTHPSLNTEADGCSRDAARADGDVWDDVWDDLNGRGGYRGAPASPQRSPHRLPAGAWERIQLYRRHTERCGASVHDACRGAWQWGHAGCPDQLIPEHMSPAQVDRRVDELTDKNVLAAALGLHLDDVTPVVPGSHRIAPQSARAGTFRATWRELRNWARAENAELVRLLAADHPAHLLTGDHPERASRSGERVADQAGERPESIECPTYARVGGRGGDEIGVRNGGGAGVRTSDRTGSTEAAAPPRAARSVRPGTSAAAEFPEPFPEPPF